MNEIQPVTNRNTFILIVEDSLTQAVFLRQLLEKAGYKVACAGNGVEALNLLERSQPALIISDILMPVMDGYTLCKRVKAAAKFQGMPFMLLTTLAEPQDIFKGLESGADFYSIKPYDAAKMLERVREIVAANQPLCVPVPATDISYGGSQYTINAGCNQILDLLLATFEDIGRKNQELVETNIKLAEALEANKTLSGLIPICGYCKKIRDDQGYWDQVESFVARHSEAKFSHGICPQCFDKTMKQLGLNRRHPDGVKQVSERPEGAVLPGRVSNKRLA